jgi:hypothetical protein
MALGHSPILEYLDIIIAMAVGTYALLWAAFLFAMIVWKSLKGRPSRQ